MLDFTGLAPYRHAMGGKIHSCRLLQAAMSLALVLLQLAVALAEDAPGALPHVGVYIDVQLVNAKGESGLNLSCRPPGGSRISHYRLTLSGLEAKMIDLQSTGRPVVIVSVDGNVKCRDLLALLKVLRRLSVAVWMVLPDESIRVKVSPVNVAYRLAYPTLEIAHATDDDKEPLSELSRARELEISLNVEQARRECPAKVPVIICPPDLQLYWMFPLLRGVQPFSHEDREFIIRAKGEDYPIGFKSIATREAFEKAFPGPERIPEPLP